MKPYKEIADIRQLARASIMATSQILKNDLYANFSEDKSRALFDACKRERQSFASHSSSSTKKEQGGQAMIPCNYSPTRGGIEAMINFNDLNWQWFTKSNGPNPIFQPIDDSGCMIINMQLEEPGSLRKFYLPLSDLYVDLDKRIAINSQNIYFELIKSPCNDRYKRQRPTACQFKSRKAYMTQEIEQFALQIDDDYIRRAYQRISQKKLGSYPSETDNTMPCPKDLLLGLQSWTQSQLESSPEILKFIKNR